MYSEETVFMKSAVYEFLFSQLSNIKQLKGRKGEKGPALCISPYCMWYDAVAIER